MGKGFTNYIELIEGECLECKGAWNIDYSKLEKLPYRHSDSNQKITR